MPEQPGVTLEQRLVQPDVIEENILYPLIIGPMFDEKTLADDRSEIQIGSYDKDNDTDYPYPALETGTEVETDSVSLVFDQAELRYFQKAKDSGSYEFRLLKGTKNKIRTAAANPSNTLVFKNSTNAAGDSFLRSAEFYDRDVQVGDKVIANSGLDEIIADVIRLESEKVPSEVQAAAPATANTAAQSASVGIPQADGGNTGDDSVASSGTYVGSLASNVINDIYTIQVIAEGGDPLTNAVADPGNDADGDVLAINAATSIWDNENSDTYTLTFTTGGAPGVAQYEYTSLRGDNSTAPITLTAFGADHALGAFGLQFQMTDGGSGDIAIGDSFEVSVTPSSGRIRVTSQSGVDDAVNRVFPGFGAAFPIASLGIDILVTDGGDTTITLGDQWTIAAAKQVEAVIATSGGDYTGESDLTYTVEVTRGGEFGNCEITVTSTGFDSSGPTVVTAADTPIPIGNFLSTISFAANAQNGLVRGDIFTVPVLSEKDGKFNVLVLSRNFPETTIANDEGVVSAVTPDGGNTQTHVMTTGGTYNEPNGVLGGLDKEVYTIEIVDGGAPGVATYSVTSASGQDDAAAASITAFAAALPVAAGGLTVSFADSGSGIFTAGDQYTFEVTKQNLSVDLHLVKTDLVVPKLREDIPASFAWENDEDEITVNASINLSVPEWRSGSVTIPVIAATMYTPYQTFKPMPLTIQQVPGGSNASEIAAILGSADPASVLGYGVKKCAEVSGSRAVKYIGLPSNDAAGWEAVESFLRKDNEIYYHVLLTNDFSVHRLFQTHVNNMSDKTKKKWRIMLTSMEQPFQEAVFETYLDAASQTDKVFTAIVSDNPAEAGTQNTLVEFDLSEPIDLISAGVREGDIFRYNYKTDQNGDIIFTSYEIKEVLSANSLILKTGPATPVTLFSQAAIYKSLTVSEQIDAIKARAEAFADRRVFLLMPGDVVDNEGNTVPGYNMAAAVVGLHASLGFVHLGLTKRDLVGFSATPFTRDVLDDDQLRELSDSGVFIITQDNDADVPYVRHQLSTDVSSEITQEFSLTTSADELSYFYNNALEGFIGVTNIGDIAIDDVRSRLAAAIEEKRVLEDRSADSQIIDGTIESILRDDVFRTKLNILIRNQLRGPLNNIDAILELFL